MSAPTLVSLSLALLAPTLLGVEITRVAPAQVASGGGTEVTFTGTGFTPDLKPRLGGQEMTSVVFIDGRVEQQLVGLSPALAVGFHAADVVSVRTGSVEARLPDAVEVVGAPVDPAISSVEPREVSTLGGTAIVVHGERFRPEMELRVGDMACPIQIYIDPRTIHAVTPPLAEGLHTLSLHVTDKVWPFNAAILAKLPRLSLECAILGKQVRLIQQVTNPYQVPALDAARQDALTINTVAGTVGHLTSYVAIVSDLAQIGAGVESWSLSYGVTGGVVVDNLTTLGTVAETAAFKVAEIVDPGKIHPITGLPQGQGFVSAAVLDFVQPVTLDITGTATVLEVGLSTDHALASGETVTANVACRPKMQGGGQPVEISATVDGSAFPVCGCSDLDVAFTAVAGAPKVLRVEPSPMPAGVQMPLRVIGEDFTPGMEVRIDGLPLPALYFTDGRTMQGMTPALAPGRHDVTLHDGDGTLLFRLDVGLVVELVEIVKACEPSNHVALIFQDQNVGQTPILDASRTEGVFVQVPEGKHGEATFYVGIVSDLMAFDGLKGWSLSLGVEGDVFPEEASLLDTAVEEIIDGYMEGSPALDWLKAEPVNPDVIDSGTGLPQGQGIVSLVLAGELEPEGTATVLRVKLTTMHPLSKGEILTAKVSCRDGLQGSPVPADAPASWGEVPNLGYTENVLEYLFLGGAAPGLLKFCECPELTVTFSEPFAVSVTPGDANLDLRVDLSDAVSLLGHLFLGRPERLPCGDGTAGDRANIALLDSNGDGRIDISDASFLLGFLFLGTRAPVLGTEPVAIAGCTPRS
jgi:hypothetical protein